MIVLKYFPNILAGSGFFTTLDPNAPIDDVDIPDLGFCGGMTTIHLAAFNGHTEIVKILASFTDYPNAPYEN